MLYDWHYDRKPSFSGVLVGAVAGLATITPCAGYVEPWAAIIIGAVGSSVCYYAKYVQERLGFDDALEVRAVPAWPDGTCAPPLRNSHSDLHKKTVDRRN